MLKPLEALLFLCIGGDDEFAAALISNAVLLAKAHRAFRSLFAQPRFGAAWLIIDPGMDDARIMPALVAREGLLLVDEDKASIGALAQQPVSAGETQNAAADDRIVIHGG